MTQKVSQKRIYKLNNSQILDGPIVYWMSRDQRVEDNWSMIYAQEIAKENKQPLLVVFCLVPNFLEATIRQYGFMLKGLQEVEARLQELNIPFYLLAGNPPEKISTFTNKIGAGCIITDFDPTHIKQNWQQEAAQSVKCAFYEVDSHNIVPCRFVSNKIEFGAYTIRPKINKLLAEFLISFPEVEKQIQNTFKHEQIDWGGAFKTLKVDRQVPEVNWLTPGRKAAHEILNDFIKNKLSSYDQDRNDPTKNAQSNLSPYLHFGQISSQRIALEITKKNNNDNNASSFLEELIVRRELSDNFCFYNPHYDSFEGFPLWSQKSLNEHEKDEREYLYDINDFEQSNTHDLLWNAAQYEMVKTGKMHGYMRMYWAKKILEWTKDAKEALKVAIYLNDKYELDGRDPNGYAGIAWSIGGVHDRAWFDRPVFGKVRFMNYNGCKSKFNVEEYIKKFKPSSNT